MPTQTLTTRLILHDSIPVGTDFIGGAEALPVMSAAPGRVVPGSDFVGGAVPPANIEHGETDMEECAA